MNDFEERLNFVSPAENNILKELASLLSEEGENREYDRAIAEAALVYLGLDIADNADAMLETLRRMSPYADLDLHYDALVAQSRQAHLELHEARNKAALADAAVRKYYLQGQEDEELLPVLLTRRQIEETLGIAWNEERVEDEARIPAFYADYVPWLDLAVAFGKAIGIPEKEAEELVF